MFSQQVSYYGTFSCLMSGPLFHFLLLVINKIIGVVLTISVDTEEATVRNLKKSISLMLIILMVFFNKKLCQGLYSSWSF